MWFWLSKGTGGRASVLAQRAVEDSPRWTRAVEAHPPVPFTVLGGGRRGNLGRSFVSTIAVTVLALTLLSGCSLFVPREEARLKQATVEELTALLSQREAAIQTMKGLFSAKVRGGIIPIASRMEGALYYRRPNAMRLRGFTAVGSELFEFVQADDQFRLRLPTMGRVLSGNPSDMSEMGKLARPFQLSVWAMGGVFGTGAIATRRNGRTRGGGRTLSAGGIRSISRTGYSAIRRRLWLSGRRCLSFGRIGSRSPVRGSDDSVRGLSSDRGRRMVVQQSAMCAAAAV